MATEQPKTRIVDRRQPIQSLPREERALAKKMGFTGENKVDRRKKNLPPRWREIVYVTCTRPHTQGQLAAALGISLRNLQYRLNNPTDPLRDAMEAARGVMFSTVIDPMYERLLKDKSQESDELRRWFAQRLFPAEMNPNVQSNAPQVHVNTQVNVAQLPRAMTPAEYAKLFADSKVIDAKSDEVPAGDARNA